MYPSPIPYFFFINHFNESHGTYGVGIVFLYAIVFILTIVILHYFTNGGS